MHDNLLPDSAPEAWLQLTRSMTAGPRVNLSQRHTLLPDRFGMSKRNGPVRRSLMLVHHALAGPLQARGAWWAPGGTSGHIL